MKSISSEPTVRGGTAVKGIVCMLLACLLITLNDAITKWLGGSYPVGQMLCARGAFFLVVVVLIAGWLRGRHAVRVNDRRAHLLRGLLSTCSAFLFVGSLKFLPLADAITITFATPLLITAMAPYFLGERVGWRRWSAVAVGFVGVALMLKPGTEALRWVALLPLAAAGFESTRDILTRRMTLSESSLSMVCVTTAVIVIVSASTSVTGWPPMSWEHAGLLAIAGLLFGAAHWLMVEALRLAEAVVVAPFRYSPVIWAALLGYLLWGDMPDGFMAAGTALVIGSGLFIFYRETRLHSPRRRRRAQPARR